MSARVLCVGIAAQDFVFQVPELPLGGQKFRAHGFAAVGGGMAGTAAVAVAKLGGDALVCARVGDDPMAALVRAELEGFGVDCSPTKPVPGAATPTSAIMVDARGERMIVNYRDDDLPEVPDLARVGSLDAVEADTRWHGGALAAMRLARTRGIPGVLDVEAPVLGQAPDAIRIASHVAFAAPGLRDFVGLPDAPLAEAPPRRPRARRRLALRHRRRRGRLVAGRRGGPPCAGLRRRRRRHARRRRHLARRLRAPARSRRRGTGRRPLRLGRCGAQVHALRRARGRAVARRGQGVPSIRTRHRMTLPATSP